MNKDQNQNQNLANSAVAVPDPAHGRPSWISDAVIYGVVPAFYDPPGFRGVTAGLDDLADLGVSAPCLWCVMPSAAKHLGRRLRPFAADEILRLRLQNDTICARRCSALWLAPITRTLPDDFGYAVTDYGDLRPEYGTTDDFRQLVEAAHARGMRVVMDFVPNHTSAAHPWFRDAVDKGESSPYWDHYDRDADGTPTHSFSWTHLPNLNYDNPEVGRSMLEAFASWVRAYDVDGFRIDAIWGIKERTPDWLAVLLREVRRLKPDALLIAEASARDPFYAEQGFDAAYDWTDRLGHWAWEEIFGGSIPIGQAMIDALTDGGRGSHEDALAMRFLNTNDTGPRFLTTHGVACYRVALAMLLTLPGLPCLFTGDEVGAAYHPYEQRGAIDWTDRAGLRDFTRRLIRLRRGTPALHSRQWIPLDVELSEPFFAYLRTDDAGGRPIVVLLNFTAADLVATVALPPAVAASFGGAVSDLWRGETVPAARDGRVTVAVHGWGFRLLAADPDSNRHPAASRPMAMGERLDPPAPVEQGAGDRGVKP